MFYFLQKFYFLQQNNENSYKEQWKKYYFLKVLYVKSLYTFKKF